MDFSGFKSNFYEAFRIDLNGYKENQLLRRINAFMAKEKVSSYDELFKLLIGDRRAYQDFLDKLTINVTEFFRDPKIFSFLETDIIPELLSKKPLLKIWSAACASGAEPYSLAIILDELTPGKRHRLDATDMDRAILKRAAEGSYPADCLKNIGRERMRRYFRQEGDRFLIADRIKRMVVFRPHDLLTESFPGGYDLIVCRNVTIYFTREAQLKVNRKFARSLNKGGVLFTGGSEAIFNYRELGYEKLRSCFYRKK